MLCGCADVVCVHARDALPGQGVGGARRLVGGPPQHTPNAKLATWSRAGGPLMVLGILLFIWGAIATAVVFADIINVKFGVPFHEVFCRHHGWQFADVDPQTGAPRYVVGPLAPAG